MYKKSYIIGGILLILIGLGNVGMSLQARSWGSTTNIIVMVLLPLIGIFLLIKGLKKVE